VNTWILHLKIQLTVALAALCLKFTQPIMTGYLNNQEKKSFSSRQENDVWRNQTPTQREVPVTSFPIHNRRQHFSNQPTRVVHYHVVRAKKALSLTRKGGHIGHNAASTLQPRLRHPLSSQLLLGKRGRGDVACPSLSVDQAAKGLHLIARVLQHGGHVLLLDTRGEASALQRFVEARASLLPPSLSFGGQHWVGGTLTNWNTISKMVFRCAQISNQFDTFLMSNRVHLPRYEKMRRSYLGFLQHNKMYGNKKGVSIENKQMAGNGYADDVKLTGHPDLLLVINPAENRQIIRESERLGIPVVGVVDSNDNLRGITVPVLINPGSLLQPDGFAIRAVQLAIGRQRVINRSTKV
jgi:small subunit ribosomal protein S2